jgi:dienelactone hydrolase
MIEQKIQIPTASGTAEGILFRPKQEGRRPGVIQYTDIGGIRVSQQEMARRLAGAGYVVLMPNVFYRTGRLPLFDFPLKFGEERTMKRLAELSGPLTPEAIACDASDYVDFLVRHDSVKPGSIGVVAYCFTGKMALYTAMSRPDEIAAAASLKCWRGGPPTRPTAPIFFWVCPLRLDSISDTPSTTRACQRKQSRGSTMPSTHGEASMKVKSTKAHITAGPSLTVRFITSRRPNALLKS